MLAVGRHRIFTLRVHRSFQSYLIQRLHRDANKFKPLESSGKHGRLLLYGLLAVAGAATASYTLFWPDTSRSAPTYSDAFLSPTHFTPVILTASEACTDPDTRLITFTVPRQPTHPRDELSFNPIWSVFVKDDDIQVERPYTPLEGIDSEGRMKFWIKKYAKGEVGRWMHSKKVGDRIDIRGPVNTWLWQEDTWDEVVMISGGTGVTPFYQLLHHAVLKNPSRYPNAKFTLLHSSSTPAELPPPEMLEPLLSNAQRNPDRLGIYLFVDSLVGPEHPSVSSSVLQTGRINKTAVERAIGLGEGKISWWRKLLRTSSRPDLQQGMNRKILFLVCGPDPMITAIAGPYGRNFSQGAVGGVLGSMGYGRDQVWKL